MPIQYGDPNMVPKTNIMAISYDMMGRAFFCYRNNSLNNPQGMIVYAR